MEAYVGSKKKMSAQAGIQSFDHRLSGTADQVELLALIARLNRTALPVVSQVLGSGA